MDTIAGHNLPEEGELRNAAVLYLHIPEAVEPLLVGISEHSKGIKEPKWGLGAKLRLEGIYFSVVLDHLGRDEGNGRASEEGGDGKLNLNALNGYIILSMGKL